MIEQTSMNDAQTPEVTRSGPSEMTFSNKPEDLVLVPEAERQNISAALNILEKKPAERGADDIGRLAQILARDGSADPAQVTQYLEQLTPQERQHVQTLLAANEVNQPHDNQELGPAPTQRTKGFEAMPPDAQNIYQEGVNIMDEAKKLQDALLQDENFDPSKPPEELQALRVRILRWLPGAGRFLWSSFIISLFIAIVLINRSFAVAGGKGAAVR